MTYKFINDEKKHVHTLDGAPLYGTSTVVGILNKPLTWWAAGMAVEKFGWLSPKKHPVERVKQALEDGYARVMDMERDEYEKLLAEAYKAHSVKKDTAAEAGTDMHAELENYISLCLKDKGLPLDMTGTTKEVEAFSAWAIKNVEQFLFAEGHTFSKTHWVGGIVDVGAKMKSGKTALLDFKSSKDAYYSQMVQIAGYALQVGENGIVTANGEPVIAPFEVDELIVVPFGSEKLVPRAVQNVKDFKTAFIGCLENYKLSKAFDE